VLPQVAAAKGAHLSFALDTKGPEIRTAMLKDGKDIMLKEGEQGLPYSSIKPQLPCQQMIFHITMTPPGCRSVCSQHRVGEECMSVPDMAPCQ